MATRFPPEPNGYLHIGHAKAICVDFGLAREFGGTCNLRFDDTNPTTEDVEYVEAIQEDIRWLGFEWDERCSTRRTTSRSCTSWPCKLIEKGKAYVDSLTEEEIREYRGNFYKKGKPSPYRDRPIAENLDLFRRMRAGEFPEGAHVLRAKIDLDVAEHEPARSGAVPDPLRAPPPHRHQVVHLPDVRLRASAVGRARRASPTRSARWSSRRTGRCTTGASARPRCSRRSRSSSRG